MAMDNLGNLAAGYGLGWVSTRADISTTSPNGIDMPKVESIEARRHRELIQMLREIRDTLRYPAKEELKQMAEDFGLGLPKILEEAEKPVRKKRKYTKRHPKFFKKKIKS